MTSLILNGALCNGFFVFFILVFLQVGNAVPPPLSRAIGLELKKCVLERMKEEQATGDSSDSTSLIDVKRSKPNSH